MHVIRKTLMFFVALCALAHDAYAERVEEARFVSIGGIDQWVTLRGNDSGPILLLVHGGPGDVQSPYVSAYVPYERDFVLVQWDQRGAGKTFAAGGNMDITLQRQVADGIELAQYLRERFPMRPLLVLGHSWGSIVATGMVQERPDLFAAYVGTGQVAAWADTVQSQFDFLRQEHAKAGAAEALTALEAIGTPDPRNLGQYFSFTRPLRQYMASSDKAWYAGLPTLALENGATADEVASASEGMNASGAALIGTLVQTDLPATATTFGLPYFVIQGRHDVSAPTALAEAYFAEVVAPEKRMIVIEDAGHFALVTHAEEMVAALRQLFR